MGDTYAARKAGQVAELSRAYGTPRTSDERWVFLWSQLAHHLIAHAASWQLTAAYSASKVQAMHGAKLFERARAARARSIAAHKRMASRRVPNACEDLVRRLAGQPPGTDLVEDRRTLWNYIGEAQEIT